MLPTKNSVPSKGSLVYDNAAVGHQLGVDRNDMLVPGKNLQYDSFFIFDLLKINT